MAVGILLLTRYLPPVYYASEFGDFVRNEPSHTQAKAQLRSRLLQQAEWYFLPVKSENIRIKDDGQLIRVDVDYKVPVNLFVFTHELSFHAAGTGFALRD